MLMEAGSRGPSARSLTRSCMEAVKRNPGTLLHTACLGVRRVARLQHIEPVHQRHRHGRLPVRCVSSAQSIAYVMVIENHLWPNERLRPSRFALPRRTFKSKTSRSEIQRPTTVPPPAAPRTAPHSSRAPWSCRQKGHVPVRRSLCRTQAPATNQAISLEATHNGADNCHSLTIAKCTPPSD